MHDALRIFAGILTRTGYGGDPRDYVLRFFQLCKQEAERRGEALEKTSARLMEDYLGYLVPKLSSEQQTRLASYAKHHRS